MPALLTETGPGEPPIEENHQGSESIEMQPMLKYAAALVSTSCMRVQAKWFQYVDLCRHILHACTGKLARTSRFRALRE